MLPLNDWPLYRAHIEAREKTAEGDYKRFFADVLRRIDACATPGEAFTKDPGLYAMLCEWREKC